MSFLILSLLVTSIQAEVVLTVLKTTPQKIEYEISKDEPSGEYKLWNLSKNIQVGSTISKSDNSESSIVILTDVGPGDKIVLLDKDGEVIASAKASGTAASSETISPPTKKTTAKASKSAKSVLKVVKASSDAQASGVGQDEYLTQLKESYVNQITQVKKLKTENSKKISKKVKTGSSDEWDEICAQSETKKESLNIVSTPATKNANSILSLCASRKELNAKMDEAYRNYLRSEKLEGDFKTEAKSDGAASLVKVLETTGAISTTVPESASTTASSSITAITETPKQTAEQIKQKELNDLYGGNIVMGNATVSAAEKWLKWVPVVADYNLTPDKYNSIKLGMVNANGQAVGGYLSQAYLHCGDYRQSSNANQTQVVLRMDFYPREVSGKVGIPVEVCKMAGNDVWCSIADEGGQRSPGKIFNIDEVKDGESLPCPNNKFDFYVGRDLWSTGKLLDSNDRPVLGEMILTGRALVANPKVNYDLYSIGCGDGGTNDWGSSSVSDETGLFYLYTGRCAPKGEQAYVYAYCINSKTRTVRRSPMVKLEDFKNGTPVKCPDMSLIEIDCKDPFSNSSYPWGTTIRSFTSNEPCSDKKCPTKEHKCEDNAKWSNLPFGGNECKSQQVSVPTGSIMLGLPYYMCGDHTVQKCPSGYAPADGTSKKCDTPWLCEYMWPLMAKSINCPVENTYFGKLNCDYICPK